MANTVKFWTASSACGVSSEHLNYKKHPMVRSVYRFHVYYHVRRVLKRLQDPLPHDAGFSPYNNPYSNEQFFKIWAYARSKITGNTATALTAQKAFLNNFENVVIRRVDIQEGIKRYQNTLSSTSNKVNYSLGDKNIYLVI